MRTQRNVFFVCFFHYEFICLAFAGQSALTKELNVDTFVFSMTDVELFTLRNNPLVPY